ncbi:MAG: undecaprenyl/decaprenyl-phosphate alpha-N-acetylglucosaminyl 1-phosphate transferase, partial [Phycisphaerales bacterium]|nr:undecaprenyl/decaprenyl-phosphate alpha-N-acetylglucosaminyl 1-phosphate transferase [Phycisphaerales bacterium]
LLAVADDGPFDGPRIILAMAVLGACLGFLPHNFNPATIFLGDTGSLLLGYCSAVMILSLGDTGKTGYVFAGLVIYAIPIIDTALAIVRRKLAGKKMSDPDADHLHHMLKRAFGVKGAVFTLYGIGLVFCVLGVVLSQFRARFIYALVLLIASYIGVWAIKVARRSQIEAQANATAKPPAGDKPKSTQPG